MTTIHIWGFFSKKHALSFLKKRGFFNAPCFRREKCKGFEASRVALKRALPTLVTTMVTTKDLCKSKDNTNNCNSCCSLSNSNNATNCKSSCS